MLPVKLPKNIDLNVRKSFGQSKKWKEVVINGKKLIRETDTLDLCMLILVFFKILFTERGGARL